MSGGTGQYRNNMADNSWFQQIRDEYGELSINEFANYWRNSKQIPDEYLGLDDVELSMQVLAENPGAAVMIDNNSMAQGVKSFWNTLKHQWAPGWFLFHVNCTSNGMISLTILLQNSTDLP